MGGKRIIVDHRHALRQHKAFAIMVILLVAAVLAVWFIQIRLMFHRVDLTKVRQDLSDAQANLQGAFDVPASDALAAGAADAAKAVTDAVAQAQATAAANEQLKAAVGAAAVDAMHTQTADVSNDPSAAPETQP